MQKEKVIAFFAESKKVAVIEPLDGNLIKLFLINGNKVLFREKYSLQGLDPQQFETIVKTAVLSVFNPSAADTAPEITREELDEAQIIYSYLKTGSGKCSHFVVPEQWLDPASPDTPKLQELLPSSFWQAG